MNIFSLIRFEDYCTDKASKEEIDQVELKIGFRFPTFFKKIAQQCDGGSIINSDFVYYDPHIKKNRENGIGCFLNFNSDGSDNILNSWMMSPELMPKNIIAFGENGGGDYICFDYRNDPTTDNPPIVFWLHEYNEGENIIFLAHTFEEFLKMLKEPEDEY